MADRFSDAAGAIQSYTRKELKVPEVSVVRPEARPVVAGDAGAARLPRGRRRRRGAGRRRSRQPSPESRVDYRNIGQVDVKVYPVDLMQLYLTRRNLNGIAGIDLAGVTPLVEKTVTLGDGADYDDKSKSIDLPLTKEGAYLTMIRGDNLYASGIVLVSPAGDGGARRIDRRPRSRITVRDARTKEFLPKVQVKVIGSDSPSSSRARPTSGRVRRRRRARIGHRRRAQGRRAVCVLPWNDLRRTASPDRRDHRRERPHRQAPARLAEAVARRQHQDAKHSQFRSGRSSDCSSATLSRPRKRREPPAGGFR